jgi:hypothetical protein
MANIQHIYTGTAAPATTPAAVGHHFVDTVNLKSYISVGTSSSADWILNNDPTALNAHLADLANPHVVTKTQVGLGNADNTSDANKPVSTAQQTALDLKADLASPALTGVPTAPTATIGTNTTQLATTAFVLENGGTTGDATTLVKGIVKLAGDLSGTAELPTVPGLAGKEPTITATTSSDYYRGDKTFQVLNNIAVGLPNVQDLDQTNPSNIVQDATHRFTNDTDVTRLVNTSGTNTGDNATNSQYSGLAASKEDVSNKATDLTSPDNVKYPTTLAVSTAQALDLKIANNLSDVASVPTAQTNLEISTMEEILPLITGLNSF